MDFTKLIDADKLGGWVRAVVGAIIATLIADYPGIKDYLTPDAQIALGVVLSSAVVGVWSHIAKQKVQK